MRRLFFLLVVLSGSMPAHAAPPANDAYADFTTISAPAPQSIIGTNLEATTEAGEPLMANMEATVWYRWTSPAAGLLEIRTTGAEFDTMLAVYSVTPGLPTAGDRLAANDDESLELLTSRVALVVTAGQTIAIQAGGYQGQAGAFPLQLSMVATPHDNYADRLVVSGISSSTVLTNAGTSTEAGEPLANPFVEATVWAVWTAPATGSCTVDTFSGAAPVMDSFLTVYSDTGAMPAPVQELGRNNDGPATVGSVVTFAAVAGQTYAFQIGGMGTARGAFTLRVALTIPPPANDSIAGAIVLGNTVPVAVSGQNLQATVEPGEHLPGANEQATVWYRWNAPDADYYQFDTLTGTGFDTILAIYSGSPSPVSLAGWNDDASSATLSSQVVIRTEPGQAYYVQIGSYNLGRGLFTLSISPALPPNDNFAGRISLPDSGAVATTGWNVRGTVEAGEALPGLLMEATVWYSWTAPYSGRCELDTISDTSFDTVLAVYHSTQTVPAIGDLIAWNDDVPDSLTLSSRVSFNAIAGRTYSIQVAGFRFARGGFPLNLELTALPPDIAAGDASGTPLNPVVPVEFVSAGLVPAPVTFTLSNAGGGSLTGISASITGADAGQFTITTPPPGTLTDFELGTFIITHNPVTLETETEATLHIVSSDPDESPLDIPLSGYALDFTADSDGDGLNNASEWQMRALGFRPFSAQPDLVAALNSGAGGAGFYRKEQLQGLHAGASFAGRDPVSRNFALKLKLRKSADLSTWSDFPLTPAGSTLQPDGTLRFEFAPPDNAAFLKLEVE